MENLGLIESVKKKLEDKKAMDIKVIHIPVGIVSCFIIASGSSSRHLKALAQAIKDFFKGEKTIRIQGNAQDTQWIALDLGSVFLHLFCNESRDYYNLEGLYEVGIQGSENFFEKNKKTS